MQEVRSKNNQNLQYSYSFCHSWLMAGWYHLFLVPSKVVSYTTGLALQTPSFTTCIGFSNVQVILSWKQAPETPKLDVHKGENSFSRLACTPLQIKITRLFKGVDFQIPS